MSLILSQDLSHYQKTIINKLYNEQNVLEFPKKVTILTYCDDENDNYEISIDVVPFVVTPATRIESNIYTIFTNLQNYCYVKYGNDYICDEINQIILTNKYYTSLVQIIDTIINFKLEDTREDENNYIDKYHFYRKLDEKTKVYINYKELQNKSGTKKNIYSHLKIPKELLLNNQQLFQLVINEIKKINTNYDYEHYIVPIDNNIFNLKIYMIFNTVNIELNIKLNSNYYPFLPPQIEIISPKVKLSLYFAIMNLNITKLNYWQSTFSLEWIIVNLYNKLKSIIQDYIELEKKYNNIELDLLKLSNLIKEDYTDKLNINFDLLQIKPKDKIYYWKSGTGYGSGNNESWDINNYIKEKEIENIEILNCLININNNINDENIIYLKSSIIFKYFLNFIDGVTLLDIENNYDIINEIFNIIKKLDNHLDIDFINKFSNNLKPIIEQILLLSENNDLYKNIQDVYKKYSNLEIKPSDELGGDLKSNTEESSINSSELYCDIMKPLQFAMNDLSADHKYYSHNTTKLEPSALKRIISEISSFKSGLPLNYDSTIWVRVPKNNINLFTFIISGPKDTPYENGLFEFHVHLQHTYPNSEPKVLLNTTGNGTVRFNPNLYNCGKVCLSLLGTWSGQESEKWNPKTSTFLQVLISIQSLILVEDPYFNEPGYERQMSTEAGKLKCKEYNNNLQIETIKWCIIDIINNPPSGYEEVVLNHFKIKKQQIIEKVDKWLEESESKYKTKLEVEVNNLKELFNKI